MRPHSANYKSKAKNRTRAPKYHHRSSSTLLDRETQSDIEACINRATARRSQSAGRLSSENVFYHHHQHHHNYYLPRGHANSTFPVPSSSGSNCDIRKFMLYAILFFAAYYLLFVAITTTYRNASYSASLNDPMLPDRVQLLTGTHDKTTLRQIYESQKNKVMFSPNDQIPEVPDSHQLMDSNQMSPKQDISASDSTKQQTQNLEQSDDVNNENTNNDDTETDEGEQKETDSQSVAGAKGESVLSISNILSNHRAETNEQIQERRRKRMKQRQEARKLKPFPQMYISDNPYYLNENLVVIGQVSDAEKRIDMILYQLESISCLFNSTTFIVFESNSKDKTVLHLQRWQLRKPLNCTQIAFKPADRRKYHELRTLEDLINELKKSAMYGWHDEHAEEDEEFERRGPAVLKYESDYDAADIDSMVVDFLSSQYSSIDEVDLYEVSSYLTKKLQNVYKMSAMEIEEILYQKLIPIKYVKYHRDIVKHRTAIYKNVFIGDEVVEKELAIETEIVKQLRVYGGLNELHLGYNVMDELERIEEEKARKRREERWRELGLMSDSEEFEDMLMFEDASSMFSMDGKRKAAKHDKVYNELDLEYNFMHGIKKEELQRHSHSDFQDEFHDIHMEIEGLIQYDEAIIHEKLRERKRKYEERRRRERLRREEELKRSQQEFQGEDVEESSEQTEEEDEEGGGEQAEEDKLQNEAEELLEMMQEEEEEKVKETEEEVARFRDKLFRIERFVVYRNFLLNKSQELSAAMGISFDYVMAIDMDVYSIDVRTFMNELFYTPSNLDGLCIDGMDWLGYTRDTFATVKINGGWLHYGHDTLVNNSKYIYNNQHAMNQRKAVPNHQENRFEEVKSCFGGIMVYKNHGNKLFNQQCRYSLTRDVFFTNYNNTEPPLSDEDDEEDDDDDDLEEEQEDEETTTEAPVFEIKGFDASVLDFNYSYAYWKQHRWHNDYSEQSKLEMKLFVKQYIELLQVFDKTVENRELIPKDGDICEHIPFHYCLWDKGFKFAISSRAKLYYDKFYPINRVDTNWDEYLQNRLQLTQ